MIRTALALLAGWRPAPPRRLGDARPGQRIRVRGRVAPRDLLDSPLAGERCVYYRYSVESFRRSALAVMAGDGFWETAEHDEAIAEFYLDDGAGRALVSPVGARVLSGRLRPRVVDLGDDLRRARELVIRPGDPVEVVGRLADALDLFDEGRDYRSDARCSALLDCRIRPLRRTTPRS
jgi:hypothetical protein